MQQQILRIIDANVNRISEGLRVLEDISRFILDDRDISGQLKAVRHGLNGSVAAVGLHLLESRDAAGDVGAGSDITREHKDLSSIVRANAKRAQEGIRVLEELAKLPEFRAVLSAAELRESRYIVYSVEKALAARLSQLY